MPTRLLALVLAMVVAGALASACSDAVGAFAPASAADSSDPQGKTMKVRLNVEGTAITATLLDNATARDFASLLPLTLTLQDYAATEKISYLPRKLSTEGAPPGSDPSVGDIAYYAPWGNVALFYRDFGYSNGLIRIGTMDSGIDVLRRPVSLKVIIELLEKSRSSGSAAQRRASHRGRDE
jgi:hypothetical protein